MNIQKLTDNLERCRFDELEDIVSGLSVEVRLWLLEACLDCVSSYDRLEDIIFNPTNLLEYLDKLYPEVKSKKEYYDGME